LRGYARMYVLASNRIAALMDADAISRLDYGGRVPRDIERDAGVTSQGRDRKLSFNNDSELPLFTKLHDIAV